NCRVHQLTSVCRCDAEVDGHPMASHAPGPAGWHGHAVRMGYDFRHSHVSHGPRDENTHRSARPYRTSRSGGYTSRRARGEKMTRTPSLWERERLPLSGSLERMGPYTMETRHAGLAQVQAHQEEINA